MLALSVKYSVCLQRIAVYRFLISSLMKSGLFSNYTACFCDIFAPVISYRLARTDNCLDLCSHPLVVNPYLFYVYLASVLFVDVHSVCWKILSIFKTLNGRHTDEDPIVRPLGVRCFTKHTRSVSVTCPLYIYRRSGRRIHHRTSTGHIKRMQTDVKRTWTRR